MLTIKLLLMMILMLLLLQDSMEESATRIDKIRRNTQNTIKVRWKDIERKSKRVKVRKTISLPKCYLYYIQHNFRKLNGRVGRDKLK